MGVRQHFKMDKPEWEIEIYYTVDDSQKEDIVKKLKELECNQETIEAARENLINAKEDTGFTYSSFNKRYSVVVIHKASSVGEFINTFEHEKNHLEMHICEASGINPYGEEAAHMSGDLAQIILEEALYSIVEL